MSQANRPTPRRIPEFSGREDEAAFWDTHDITDYLDELEPVPVTFAETLSTGVMVTLTPELLTKLERQAKQRGVSATMLARQYIVAQIEAGDPQP